MERLALSAECRPAVIGIAVARTNEFVTERLVEGALAALRRHGQTEVTVVDVAGSFELIPAARRLIDSGAAGVILLGAIIRGETPHFDFLLDAVAAGCGALCAAGHLVTCGVLTTDTLTQATDRCGGKLGNKGEEAAVALLQLLSAVERLTGK